MDVFHLVLDGVARRRGGGRRDHDRGAVEEIGRVAVGMDRRLEAAVDQLDGFRSEPEHARRVVAAADRIGKLEIFAHQIGRPSARAVGPPAERDHELRRRMRVGGPEVEYPRPLKLRPQRLEKRRVRKLLREPIGVLDVERAARRKVRRQVRQGRRGGSRRFRLLPRFDARHRAEHAIVGKEPRDLRPAARRKFRVGAAAALAVEPLGDGKFVKRVGERIDVVELSHVVLREELVHRRIGAVLLARGIDERRGDRPAGGDRLQDHRRDACAEPHRIDGDRRWVEVAALDRHPRENSAENAGRLMVARCRRL